jgi:hypothetical protein
MVEPAPMYEPLAMRTGATRVEVAGDGPGADIDPCAYLRIADVGEVVRFGPGADAALLHFHEVADMDILSKRRARTQPRIGPDATPRADPGIFQKRKRKHLRVGSNRHIAQHAIGSDFHPVTQPHTPFEHAIHVDRHIFAASEFAAHVDAPEVGQGNA